MPDIFQYVDYRAYLKDYFEESKAKSKVFSHMNFARKAGIKSSGFILHVMKGERNLTRPVLLKVARAIKLNKRETEYFEDLVCFDQAKNQTDKNYYFERIAQTRKSINIKTLDDRQYEFYSAWYHSVLRELITLIKDNRDKKLLSKLLVPSITLRQVQKSLKLQEELRIIKKDKKGRYSQTQSFIAGGGPVRNMAVVNFQRDMLKLALETWERFKNKEISMSTVTMCMSEELVETIRKEIQKFKERILEIVGNEKKKPERVFNLNLNLFPVSKHVDSE